MAGEVLPLCNRKQVVVSSGTTAGGFNSVADFFLFTEVPRAGRIVGLVLNDLANEFSNDALSFGEKQALAWLPISIQDYNGNEMARTYTDEFGAYNALVPSTFTMNLPIPGGSGDLAYHTLISEVVIPFLDQKKPQMLLISFGFDTHWRDPLGSMRLSGAGIHKVFETLRLWAEDNCDNRLAVFLEGGYDLEAGRVSGQAVAAALIDQPWKDPLGPAPTPEGETWQNTLAESKRIWGL